MPAIAIGKELTSNPATGLSEPIIRPAQDPKQLKVHQSAPGCGLRATLHRLGQGMLLPRLVLSPRLVFKTANVNRGVKSRRGGLGDTMAVSKGTSHCKALLMEQEARRSPGPASPTGEGEPFAMRIILKREEGKLLALNFKERLQAMALTRMVSQDGVILVTGPDPVLHVGDTLPPEPPAFVAHLEAGEGHKAPWKAVGLSHLVPFSKPGETWGCHPWVSRHPPCSQLLPIEWLLCSPPSCHQRSPSSSQCTWPGAGRGLREEQDQTLSSAGLRSWGYLHGHRDVHHRCFGHFPGTWSTKSKGPPRPGCPLDPYELSGPNLMVLSAAKML